MGSKRSSRSFEEFCTSKLRDVMPVSLFHVERRAGIDPGWGKPCRLSRLDRPRGFQLRQQLQSHSNGDGHVKVGAGRHIWVSSQMGLGRGKMWSVG